MFEIDFEELVIGCILNSHGKVLDHVYLESADFDAPWFAEAFDVIQDLAKAGRVVDVFSVSAKLNPVARQRVVAACDFGVVPSPTGG